MAKVWFITGAGRGFGRAVARAALERGDKVAAGTLTHENLAGLAGEFGDNVLPLALDVRDRDAAIRAMAAAKERFGRIDVVVNNAGRGMVAAIEEAGEQAIRDLVETNLLGTLWVTQAALPVMREQGHGHIVQISSGNGIVSSPMLGIYQATKFGVDGMSEALAQELAHLGIRVTIVQAGFMETEFGPSMLAGESKIDAYSVFRERMAAYAGRKGQDPDELAGRLLALVDDPDPPLRVLLGRPLDDIRKAYEERLQTWSDWQARMSDG